MQKKIIASGISLFLGFVGVVNAEPYLGIALGQSDQVFEERETALEITAGNRFMDAVGFEVSYIDLGEQKNTLDNIVQIDGLNLGLSGFLPITDQFEVYGKIGYFMWESESTFQGLTAEKDGNDLSYGFGAAFDVAEGVKANLEYKQFDLEDSDEPSMLSFGVSYSF